VRYIALCLDSSLSPTRYDLTRYAGCDLKSQPERSGRPALAGGTLAVNARRHATLVKSIAYRSA
jgi:hypothetical protein